MAPFVLHHIMMQDSDNIISTTTTTTSSSHSLCLHDCLALGEVEIGLSSSSSSDEEKNGRRRSSEEVERLPLLLRLLSSSRPLSSCPSFHSLVEKEQKEQEEESTSSTDQGLVIQQAVNCLEDRAAIYSQAEEMESVACHLAPYLCRRLGKLQHPTSKSASLEELERVATNPLAAAASSKKRQRRRKQQQVSQEEQNLADFENDNDRMEDDDDKDDDMSTRSDKEQDSSHQQRLLRRDSVILQQEDSQEATVSKTLSELALLVVQSIKKKKNTSDVVVLSDDSILQQQQGRPTTAVDGSSASSDAVPATVAALLHYAPVLRSKQVANALCRASCRQADALIRCIGANCPASVPCLLRGCIMALANDELGVASAAALPEESHNDGSNNNKNNATVLATTTAKRAVRACADLSEREKSRIRTILRQEQCMVDVQLQLALSESPLEAACLLIEHLSLSSSSSPVLQVTQVTRDNEQKEESPSCHQPHSLRDLLETEPALLKLTLDTLREELTRQREKDNGPIIWGGFNIVLTAYAWVLYRVSTVRLLEQERGTETTMDLCVSELQAWANKIDKLMGTDGGGESKMESVLDRPFSLLLCATFATLASTFRNDHPTDNTLVREACCSCLRGLIRYRAFSHRITALVAQFVSALRCSRIDTLLEEILGQMMSLGVTSRKDSQEWLSKACDWTSTNLACDLMAMLSQSIRKESFTAYLPAALQLIQSDEENAFDLVKKILNEILETSSQAPSLLLNPIVPAFIEAATRVMHREDAPNIPLVLPVQMEILSRAVSLKEEEALSEHESRFILCLLYCFAFMELESDTSSPFIFDPRVLPLTEVRAACETLPPTEMCNSMRVRLAEMIDRHCPEIEARARLRILRERSSSHVVARRKELSSVKSRGNLLRVLRRSVEDPDSDPSGMVAEREFVLASKELRESDVFQTVVSALTAERNAPPSYYTYSALCRDPLALLKCPLNIWEREGLRRIVLSMLGSLLETNNNIACQFSPSEESQTEFLNSRDELLVRCLATVMDPAAPPKKESSLPYCSMTVNLVRKNIAKNRGLLAMLLKQGLPESTVDWVVDWVPETMEDFHALGCIFSERNSLAPAERLVAADGILRIAVAHGHRLPEETKVIVYTALSQLIASFFLVIGPVGVPVNTLVGDGTGLDATHLSRRATFRMLRALQWVRGYRSELRSECVMALQKLAGLCKGESIVGAVPGAIASRQKKLMREIMEAIVQAATAMGSGLQI